MGALAYPAGHVVFIETKTSPGEGHFSIFVPLSETHGFYLDAHTSKKNHEILANTDEHEIVNTKGKSKRKSSKRKRKRAFGGTLTYDRITAIETRLEKNFAKTGEITF